MPDDVRGIGADDRSTLMTAAVAGVCLVLTSFFQPPDGPKVGSATASDVRDFAASHATGLKVAATAGMIAVIAVIVFTVSLARLARTRLPGSSLPRLTESAGLVIAFVLFLDTAANALTLLLPDLINTDLAKVDDATVVSWYGLTGFTHFLGDLQMALVALVLVSFSLSARRARLLPRWLVWAGLAFGACAAAGTVGITTAGSVLYWFWFAGLLGWALWILLVSLTLAARWWRSRPTAAAPVAAAA